MPISTLPKLTVVLAIFTFLSSCGGGSDSPAETPKQNTNFSISTSSSDGGAVSPQTISVVKGGNTTFTLTPEQYYSIDNITGCANGELNSTEYIVSNIQGDCTLNVSFKYNNQAPTAVAGDAQSVITLSSVTLNGDVSSDLEDDESGTALTYFWSQTDSSGFAVTLSDTSLVSPTFVAPSVTEDTTLTFQLTVTDSGSLLESSVIEITITPLQIINYTLSASANEGGAVSPQTISVVKGGNTTFTLTPEQYYSIDNITGCANGELNSTEYIVSNIQGDCTLNVSLKYNNQAPTAVAGDAQSVIALSSVTLNGDVSSDLEDDESGTALTYFWSQTDSSGVAVTLSDTGLVSPTFVAPSVTEDTILTFQLTVTDSGSLSESSVIEITITAALIIRKLNDTGINTCSDASTNGLGCPVTDYNGQDAEQGRDAQAAAGTLTKVGAGSAGFDFTKLDANGDALPASATQWSCVQDNHTGLIWEVKTDTTGLHYNGDKYNWYNTDTNTNGGAVGIADNNGNSCYNYNSGDANSFCNTQAFVDRVNASNNGQGLCGSSQWRLPNQEELRSIVDYSTFNPAIDTDYFPNTQSSYYWSSSPYASSLNGAWIVYFNDGNGGSYGKSSDHYVRLVRGGQ